MIYRGDRLPAELYGNMFVAEPAANLVSRIVIEDDGTALRARKAYEKGEFLASTDERFRPVWLSNAPDGTLYIVDMYRGVIQQRADITEYLRDHIVKRKLEQPTGLGRIYRVVHETTKRRHGVCRRRSSPARSWSRRLSHPNGWWRDTRAAAARRARRHAGGAGARTAGDDGARTGRRGCTRCGRSTASTRSSRRTVVDGARRSVARSPGVGDPHLRALAGGAEPARCRPRC